MGSAPTFDDIVALAPQHRAVLLAVRARVGQEHPDVVEVARPGYRAVSWGFGAKMTEAYAYALPYRDHVNLGFYQGTSLPDPAARLKGTGKAMRHIPLSDPADLDDPAVLTLIRAARDERRIALNL
ncbi:MAG: DUF1801 domain-containing protein [Rhodobacterales bacterium]|nr:DUF1801 domain-containing protein [Rhodobacterales bacterium]